MKTKRTIWLLAVVMLLLGLHANAAMVDLTKAGESGVINGANFLQETFDTSTGTGLFEPFVRLGIGTRGVESGYNTAGTLEFNTKSGLWTHPIQLKDIPEISEGVYCIRLDINEAGGEPKDDPLVSLDKLQIFLAPVNDNTGYPALGALVYDLDGAGDSEILLNYGLNPGSGNGDMVAEIPIAGDGNQWVYLYSEFGGSTYNGPLAGWGDEPGVSTSDWNWEANDGFEEWGVIPDVIPEPATMVLLGLGSVLLRKRK
ncbi:MAG: PEP-CTERM sorting domain-containing protein [Planctomycetota bacterium]|jgi:hypothetical protein